MKGSALGLFPATFIDDLKSHADIVQVVQERMPCGAAAPRRGTLSVPR